MYCLISDGLCCGDCCETFKLLLSAEIMMKTGKIFQIGDKVFAKVKGYPAWPAKIIGVNGKKYDVMFYGTGETGTIKAEDLFLYLQYKEQFIKPLKRKDYNDSIEQIEKDIQMEGVYGNSRESAETNKAENSDASDEKLPQTSAEKKKKFKKRSNSSDSENLNSRKKRRLSNTSSKGNENEGEISFTKRSDTEEANVTSIESAKEVSEQTVGQICDVEKIEASEKASNKTLTEKDIHLFNGTANSENKYVLVNIEHLNGIVAYADYVRNNKQLFEKKPVDQRSLNEELLVAKLPDGRLAGVLCTMKPLPDCSSEYEMAQLEASFVTDVLALKKKLENGDKRISDHPQIYILDVTEPHVQNAIKSKILEGKKSKLRWLKVESNLLQYDSKIKAALALDKANPREALDYMELMLKLQVDPLMLKKHPHVMDMVKRLRKYVGNVKEWDMKGDELKDFLKDAETIRTRAEEVYVKFKTLFGDIRVDCFWDGFTELVEEFKRQTKDLTESNVFSLRYEPNSRDAFLDQYQEHEDVKLNETVENSKVSEGERHEKENVKESEVSPRIKEEQSGAEDAH